MSISISHDNSNVTLTRKSAFRYTWHEQKNTIWLLRVVKSISAFFVYRDMRMDVLTAELKIPGAYKSDVLRNDVKQAIADRQLRVVEERKLNKERAREKKAKKVKKWKEKNKLPAPVAPAGAAPGKVGKKVRKVGTAGQAAPPPPKK